MLSIWQDLQTALERQDLSRTSAAGKPIIVIIISIIIVIIYHRFLFSLFSAASVLQDRVAKLQELYMRDLDQSKALTVHEGIQQSNLRQLATPEMLALSQPPADFRFEEDARSTRIVPALHEIEGLRRECKYLKDQVNNTQTAAATFWEYASAGKSADWDCCGLSSLQQYSTLYSVKTLCRLTQSLPASSRHCAMPMNTVRIQHSQAASQYACV